MDARRGTLASEGPLGNALPHQPIPQSVMKKPSQRTLGASRQSMLPQASHRLSVMPGGSQPTLSHSASQDQLRRSTIMNSRSDVPMGQSANRGDGGIYGRTPQSHRMLAQSSVRRSSVYTSNSGRQSMAPANVQSGGTRDTRPIRDKTFQAQCQANVAEYLLASHCPVAQHARLLTSPTLKEFQQIFKFLVRDFTDNGSWSKRFEDDAQTVLKDLRYPAMDTVGKTAMTAPGSHTNWTGLLAALNWLVELNRAHDRWYDREVVNDPLLLPARDLPLDTPILEERAFYNYISTAFKLWWHEEQDEFPEQAMEYEMIYDRLTQASFDECERLETNVQKRRAELQLLQAQEPPLKALEEEYARLLSDKTKFFAFIDMHRQKAEKIRMTNERARVAIKENESQIEILRAELARVEEAVSAQNLAPDEVNRMNHDRERLTRDLEELRIRNAEASQHSYDQEMAVTKSMDRFEQLLSDYTALGHQIGTIPPISDGPGPALGPDGVDYTIDIDLGIEDLGEIQNAGRRMRGSIWPALQRMGEDIRRQTLEFGNEQIALDDQIDKQAQVFDTKREEAATKQVKLKILSEQADEHKAAIQAESSLLSERVAKVEAEVATLAAQNQKGSLDVMTELEEKRIQYQELKHKTVQLQDNMVAELTKHIHVIIKAKEHTANSLKGVRSFAEAQ